MKSKDKKQLLNTLSTELAVLNDSITGKFAREKIALQDEWTQSNFEGPKDHILFIKYQEMTKTEYAAKLQKEAWEICEANYKMSNEEYGAIRDVFLEQFSALYMVIESEFSEVSDATKLSLDHFRKEMMDYIGGFLTIEHNHYIARKESPAVKSGKRAVKLAWFALVIAVIALIPNILTLIDRLVASFS